MMKTNLIVFNRENIEDALKIIGAHIENKIDADGTVTLFVANQKDEPFFCHNCDRLITPQDIGNITPGSKHLFCKRATCFSKYLIEHKV